MVFSLEYNYFIFHLAYLTGIFQQLNEVNLKPQEGQSSIDTLSTFVEKL